MRHYLLTKCIKLPPNGSIFPKFSWGAKGGHAPRPPLAGFCTYSTRTRASGPHLSGLELPCRTWNFLQLQVLWSCNFFNWICNTVYTLYNVDCFIMSLICINGLIWHFLKQQLYIPTCLFLFKKQMIQTGLLLHWCFIYTYYHVNIYSLVDRPLFLLSNCGKVLHISRLHLLPAMTWPFLTKFS